MAPRSSRIAARQAQQPPQPQRRPRRDGAITANWCNRVLRQLRASLARFEREREREREQRTRQQLCGRASGCLRASPRSTPTAAARRLAGAAEDASSDLEGTPDPTWLPGNGRAARNAARPRHQYRSRKRRHIGRNAASDHEPRRLLPGEISFELATDPSARSPWPASSDDTVHDGHRDGQASRSSALIGNAAATTTATKPAVHASTVATPQHEQSKASLHSLRVSWLTFLDMTKGDDAPGRPGARSLFAMACRRTSVALIEQQSVVDEENDEDVDVAYDTFTWLEDTYSLGNGWRPLKAMAREHGIGLLCSAIRRGLLTLAMFDYLCGATALNGHCDALEAVQRAWRQSISHPLQWPTPPMHKGSAPRCSPPALRPLFTYARLGSTLRELTAFIDDGQLPVEWAASSALRTVVAEALSSLAKRDRTTHAAAAFIASILRRAVAPSDPPYKPVQSQSREAQATALRAKSARHMTTAPSPADETAEAFSNTVASLLVILCSLHVRSAGHSAATQSVAFHVIASVIYDCMLTRSDTPTCSSKQNQVRRSYVFLAFLVFMTQGLDRLACLQRFEAVCQSFTDKSLVVRCLSSFAINLSCSHQADPESGFPRLQTIVRTLLCVDGSSYPTAHALLGKAAVEVTADYAQLTFSPDHHEFAVSVQREVEARRYACTIELTPSLALKGYRWDDGFGEWVMVTAARGRGRDVKCRGRRHERGRALRTTSEIERSSHCDDMDTLRCESPVILDSQQTDSSESSQGSAVFSTGPSDAGSSVESDSPSPSLRKRPLVLVDESDGEPQPLNRHTRRRRLDIVDSEGEETEPESQGDCESPLRGHQLSHAVRSLRGRRSRNDDRHVDPPRDGDGGYLIRSRPRRPGVRVQIYQDQRSGRRSLSPAKAASEGDETSNPRRHGRHVLRERRSGGNIAPSPAAAQHLHKSGKDSQVKVPRFAVVIDNTRRSTASSLHGASERASRPAHRVAAVAKHVPRQVPPALDDDGAISEDELSHDIPPPMPPGLARRRSRSRRHSPLVHAAHFAARSSVSSPAHVVLDSQTSTDSDDELSFLV